MSKTSRLRVPAKTPAKATAETPDTPLEECEAHVAELKGLVAHLSVAGSELPSAAVVVHEVAQPVTAATNYLAVAEQLLSENDAGANSRGLVAVRHAQKCLARTGEVMANVKEGAAAESFDPRPQELDLIVAEVIQMLQIESASVPLIEIPSTASRVMGDRVQLGQVFSNLVRNALEATEGQAVRLLRIVSRKVDRDCVEIRIEDNGPGIPEKMKGLLFSAFAGTKSEGAGIGLSICRAIVEQHHGRIWAEDLPRGSAFCFTLPSVGGASRPRKRRGPPRRPVPTA